MVLYESSGCSLSNAELHYAPKIFLDKFLAFSVFKKKLKTFEIFQKTFLWFVQIIINVITIGLPCW